MGVYNRFPLKMMEFDSAQAKKEREKAYQKAYRVANAAYFKAYRKSYNNAHTGKMKEYRVVHAEDIKAKEKSYRAAHATEIKARKKAYYTSNAVDIKVKSKVYRAAHTAERKAYEKSYKAVHAVEIKVRQNTYSKAYYTAHAAEIQVKMKLYRQTKLGCVECKEWPDWRIGLKHFDGHCYRCFCEKFPMHEKVKTKIRKELQVRAFIDRYFQDFVHDQPIHTAHCDCNHRRRVDHRRVVGNTMLCIETDEHAHRGYDPEDQQARYHDVIMAWGGPLCFVRFNPDGRGPPIKERLQRLHVEIMRHIDRLERGENTSWLEVYHLYYPKGTPDFYESALCLEQ